MKKLLLFCLLSNSCFAAMTPTLTNFYSPDFVIDVTGLPTEVIKFNYTNANSQFSNNVVNVGLWTNNSSSYEPTQPQGSLRAYGVESRNYLLSVGAFITQLSAYEFLVIGSNAVSVSNESYIALVGSDPDPTLTQIHLSSGNGVGQHLFLVNSATNSGFTLPNGDPLWDNPSLYVALKGGDWVTATNGETIELLGTFNGWAEIGRFGSSTNSIVSELTINPTDSYLPYRVNSTTFGDSPMYRIDTNTVAVDILDAGEVAVTNLQSSGLVFTDITGLLMNITNAPGFLHNDGSNNFTYILFSDVCLWTNIAGRIQPIDLTAYVGWTNQLRVGPGGDGTELRLYPQGNLAQLRGTAGVGLFDALTLGNEVRWFVNKLLPMQTNTVFGGDPSVAGSSPIGIVNQQTNYVWGFMNTIDTNYSRLAIYHTGTNSNRAIFFESQSAGTAGPARPFIFTNAAVVVTTNGTASQPAIALVNPTSGTGIYRDASGGVAMAVSGDGILGFNSSGATVTDGRAFRFSTSTSDPFATVRNGIYNGAGTPEGVLGANIGSVYCDYNAGGAIWSKRFSAGTVNGWVPMFPTQHTPASSAETNYQGAITWDSTNLYFWITAGENKKIPLTSW